VHNLWLAGSSEPLKTGEWGGIKTIQRVFRA